MTRRADAIAAELHRLWTSYHNAGRIRVPAALWRIIGWRGGVVTGILVYELTGSFDPAKFSLPRGWRAFHLADRDAFLVGPIWTPRLVAYFARSCWWRSLRWCVRHGAAETRNELGYLPELRWWPAQRWE